MRSCIFQPKHLSYLPIFIITCLLAIITNADSAQAQTRRPASPSNVWPAVAANQYAVVLTWRDRSSGSSQELGFTVRREQRIAGQYRNRTDVVVAANTTSYIDYPGVGVFRYRVSAFNLRGVSGFVGNRLVTVTQSPPSPAPSSQASSAQSSAAQSSSAVSSYSVQLSSSSLSVSSLSSSSLPPASAGSSSRASSAQGSSIAVSSVTFSSALATSSRSSSSSIAATSSPSASSSSVPPSNHDDAPALSGYLRGFGWSPGTSQHENIVEMFRNVYDPADPNVAVQAAAFLATKPAGERAMIWVNGSLYDLIRFNPNAPGHRCIDPATGQPLTDAAMQCPYLESGTAVLKAKFRTFYQNLRNLNAQLDMVTVDFETTTFSPWSPATEHGMAQDPNRYLAIQNDPRFLIGNPGYPAGDVRALSLREQLGFSELSRVFQWNPVLPGTNYFTIWNDALDARVGAYISEAVYDSAAGLYPNLKVSDFPTTVIDPTRFDVPNFTGFRDRSCQPPYYCASGSIVGTHQNMSIGYDYNLSSAFTERAISFDGQVYEATPFNSFRQTVNRLRAAKLSSNIPLAPTVACKSFGYPAIGSDSALHQEIMIHAALTGVDHFIFWNPHHPTWDNIRLPCPNVSDDNEEFNRTLREFNTLIGPNGRTTRVTELTPWHSHFVLTGMDSPVATIWRFTPVELPASATEPAVTVASTLISSSPPTFATRSGIVQFPGGVIRSFANPASSRGYWIEQSRGASPVLLADTYNSPPVARLSAYQRQSNGWVYLDGTTSSDDEGPVVSYRWDLNNDGQEDWVESAINLQNSASATVSHLPNGSNTVRLTVRDNLGSSSSVVRSFTIPSTPCNGRPVVNGACQLH